MHRCLPLLLLVLARSIAVDASAAAALDWADDQFELPAGFHIYLAAGPELSGGSYALACDGEGRLLVGDGKAVRRLLDTDGNGVFDRFEEVAGGLGPRGPQGLLVYGDDLYAVGGDGLQRFSGYRSTGPLKHEGRLGNKLRTGGDHDTHTVLRGHDGYLYLVAGNGAGLADRQHITEESSPVLFEREASVFRVSPDGTKWECIGSGGRNPPSLGVNSLGEFFSFDSDMEWHVGLPFYRPVRLNHWATGGDQGWQEVGAYRPWFIDNLPGILDLGRGSPNWGVFYEHNQLPEQYQDAFLVCDYRWKGASDNAYATTGRLVAFLLRRDGAGWKARMETLARPRPGARHPDGRPIDFAAVDVAVAADGSLFVSDHNQGIWRICYTGADPRSRRAPPLVPPWPTVSGSKPKKLEAMLSLPQPGSERTRVREAALRADLGEQAEPLLRAAALDAQRALPQRLRAVRTLAPGFSRLPEGFLITLAHDARVELRAQAAWLLALRQSETGSTTLLLLLSDTDPFVRRRAAEALTRLSSARAVPSLLEHLEDPERMVRYVAMIALAHRPAEEWFERGVASPSMQVRLRTMVAAHLRREPPDRETIRHQVGWLLDHTPGSREDRLDVLRVLDLFREPVLGDAGLKEKIQAHLLRGFPDADPEVSWEQVRLLGSYAIGAGFAALRAQLLNEKDPVSQFHQFTALSKLRSGWSVEDEQATVAWLLGTQKGWFADFNGKGVQFPEFWSTVVTEFVGNHRESVLRQSGQIDLKSVPGNALLSELVRTSPTGAELIALYEKAGDHATRLRILNALRPLMTAPVATLMQEEHDRIDADTPEGAAIAGAILQYWAEHPGDVNMPYLVYEGLFHDDAAVVRASVKALAQRPEKVRDFIGNRTKAASKAGDTPQAEFAGDLLHRMEERPELLIELEQVLAMWSGEAREGFKPGSDLRRSPDANLRQTVLGYWRGWYERKFGRKPAVPAEGGVTGPSEPGIHKFLLGDGSKGGDARRGGVIYERLQCQTCHAGGATPGQQGRLFGPDLAGVTRRLTRPELADALVYPSRQVADRYKAVEISLKNGQTLTGFITEQTTEAVTLADRDQVRKLDHATIGSIKPLATSLMPEGLLSRLAWDEIRDLMAYLEQGWP